MKSASVRRPLNVDEEVLKLLHELSDRVPDLEDTLRGDLEIDSLEFVQFQVWAEDKFDLQFAKGEEAWLPFYNLAMLDKFTAQHLVDYVEQIRRHRRFDVSTLTPKARQRWPS